MFLSTLKHKIKRIPTIFLLAFSAMLLVSAIIIGVVESSCIRAEKNQMQYFAVMKSNKIVEAIVGLLYKAEALSALVIQDGGEISGFDRIAAILVNDPAIQNVLIAPQGIVARVYPWVQNKEVVGFNLLGPGAGNKEALLARDSGKLTLGGPFHLIQGGQALVGRLPVFFNDDHGKRFWGLVSVTLRYPEALASVNLEDINKLGYATEIWRISPDTQEKQSILRSSDQPLINPVERKFRLLNAEWIISVASTTPWYTRLTLIFYAITGFFVSLIVGVLVQNYVDTWRMKELMENMAMTDVLTDLPNRRALFKSLESTVRVACQTDRHFVLAYMDLNAFKNINDTYGHGVGDIVLRETAYRIQTIIGTQQMLARVGGDEFIVIFQDATPLEKIHRLCAQIEEKISTPLRVDSTITLSLSISIGLAFFPENGTDVDSLVHHADVAMYNAKRKSYEKREM